MSQWSEAARSFKPSLTMRRDKTVIEELRLLFLRFLRLKCILKLMQKIGQGIRLPHVN